jgi:predicted ArsR family transcriptional regulator
MTEPDLFTYPASPGFKAGGTSRDAADSMKPSAPLLRARVLARIRAVPGGITADEAAASLGLSVLSVRPRFSELAADGLIKPTGERRKNASLRAANVWKAT